MRQSQSPLKIFRRVVGSRGIKNLQYKALSSNLIISVTSWNVGKPLMEAMWKVFWPPAVEISSYINVDDTGARHNGENGVCTHIGNELFAWFESTESKSRINFLSLLRAGQKDYHLIPEALEYMKIQKLPNTSLLLLEKDENKIFTNKEEWENHLQGLGITQKRHIQIATEGVLIGSVLEHGFNPDMVIMSDDAGQFAIKSLLHALCWVHAERTIRKVIPYSSLSWIDRKSPCIITQARQIYENMSNGEK